MLFLLFSQCKVSHNEVAVPYNLTGVISLKLKCMHIFGFCFTVVLGTLLHFTFELFGGNTIIALFSAVNESVWEHLKLLFVPMLLFGIFEYFVYGRELDSFIQVRFLSILLGLGVIIAAVYIYTGIIGRHFLPVDISIFIIAVFIAYRFSCKILSSGQYSSPREKTIAVLGFICLVLIFCIFTFFPPKINMFLDPVTGTYGILKK